MSWPGDFITFFVVGFRCLGWSDVWLKIATDVDPGQSG
jgi:hypothetical protein